MDPDKYHTFQFPGQLVDGDFSAVRPDDDVDDDQEVDIFEQWKPISDLIIQTTRSAFASSPPAGSSASDFQSYWRGVFSELHDSVVANPDIPQYVTDPPVKGFEIHLFDKHPGCCPCDLPLVPPNIKIYRDNGVTKGDLVKAVADYVYEGALPENYSTEDGSRASSDAGCLAFDVGWMTQGRREKGNVAMLYYFARGFQIASFVLYCCSPKDYMAKYDEREAERAAAQAAREAKAAKAKE